MEQLTLESQFVPWQQSIPGHASSKVVEIVSGWCEGADYQVSNSNWTKV
jgi:hypothetical protein